MDKILKYFELPIEEVKEWGWKDYLIFVVESLYTTVFPFIAGMLLVSRQQVIWIFMLVLPIYFRITILKRFDSKRNKRIYVK
jgi:hypothetical protein